MNTTSATTQQPGSKTWIAVFIFGFLVLMMDGADLMFLSYSLKSLIEDFGLSNSEAGSLQTITLFGMAIGGIYGGWASDRFGRVKTVTWCVVIFSVGTAALGATHNYWQFAIFRFLAALGLGAAYVTCNTLMAEYVPTKYRTTVLGGLQAGWSVGYLLATILAGAIIPVHGWRWLFYIALIPVVLAFLMHWIVPEPESWIRANAKRLKDKADNLAGKVVEKAESAYKIIFSDPTTRKMFLLWCITAGFLQFGYYGIGSWMPTYLEQETGLAFKKMTDYMVGYYTAMILGKIIAGWVADKIGRRAVYAFGAMGAAVCIPLIVWYGNHDNIIYLMIAFGFVYGIPYGVNATYMTESFETKIRGTAVGGAYNVGRVMAMAAPMVIGGLADAGHIGMGFLVMGGAYFLCGLVPALFIKDKQFDPQK
ncbi:Putative metabolite transport protein YjhB [Saezia sanguinis]|jgi:AAHS family cis,cis-muconate transporter-like MFS transporter|uniref:Metabolite transport protein YjhB n=1 Tax=Saezia sanguinis TaxID=1965230 RepID=A0A433SDL2_9BURK|nr:MFS transporter [Saezia sanguinis]RUS66818.1 Putative metabolite transport protein YjhB [Saezia sanguinis]